MNNKIDLYVFGAGGLAREIVQMIQCTSEYTAVYKFHSFVVRDRSQIDESSPFALITEDDFIELVLSKNEPVAIVIGISDAKLKQKIYKWLSRYDSIIYPNIIDSSSIVSSEIKCMGTIIGPLSHVSIQCEIGDFVYIGPQCGIGHDTTVGSFASLFWNVTLAGNVKVEEGAIMGSKSCVKQGLVIGAESVVGMGTVVVKNVECSTTMVGNPAKVLVKEED